MSQQPSKAERVGRLVRDGAQLLAARRPGEAVVKLIEARELDPRDVSAAINLGGAYIMQGKHDSAVPILESAAQLEPDNVMIWTNLAAAYLGKLPLASQARQDRAIWAYRARTGPGPRHAPRTLQSWPDLSRKRRRPTGDGSFLCSVGDRP